jgi:hypothetical protein
MSMQQQLQAKCSEQMNKWRHLTISLYTYAFMLLIAKFVNNAKKEGLQIEGTLCIMQLYIHLHLLFCENNGYTLSRHEKDSR